MQRYAAPANVFLLSEAIGKSVNRNIPERNTVKTGKNMIAFAAMYGSGAPEPYCHAVAAHALLTEAVS